MKSLCAIAGVLLSALAAVGCAVDDPSDSEDDQLANSAGSGEVRETPSGTTADVSSLGSANHPDPESSVPSVSLGITANACRTTCRDVVHPELCFFIPFPFCLIPQHECVTLCDAP